MQKGPKSGENFFAYRPTLFIQPQKLSLASCRVTHYACPSISPRGQAQPVLQSVSQAEMGKQVTALTPELKVGVLF